MRRGLATASLILVLAGIELSTGAVSLMVDRFGVGFQGLVSEVEFHVSRARFGGGILALGMGVAIGLLLFWSGRLSETVGSLGAVCPDCGNTTRRVKRKGWQRLLSFLMGVQLTKRRCEMCGWSGLSQRV